MCVYCVLSPELDVLSVTAHLTFFGDTYHEYHCLTGEKTEVQRSEITNSSVAATKCWDQDLLIHSFAVSLKLVKVWALEIRGDLKVKIETST